MANLRPWKPIWESSVFGDWSKELESMSREMSRLFGGQREGDTARPARFWPATDISESNEGWRLKVDIPGIDKENVELSVHNNVLTIKGAREQEKTEESENYLRTERSYGTFERDFTLPSGTEEEKISANFRNGTLEVFIPKPPEETTKGRSIPIEA